MKNAIPSLQVSILWVTRVADRADDELLEHGSTRLFVGPVIDDDVPTTDVASLGNSFLDARVRRFIPGPII